MNNVSMIKAIKKYEYRFEVHAEKLLWYHPVFGFFSIFVGIPLIALCAVCAITIIFAFPMSLLFGWV